MPGRQRVHYLYRYYDRAGRLLYVGRTVDPDDRKVAQGNEFWYPFATVRVIGRLGHMTRRRAAAIEKTVIMSEKPVFNKQHNPERDVEAYLRGLDLPVGDPLGLRAGRPLASYTVPVFVVLVALLVFWVL